MTGVDIDPAQIELAQARSQGMTNIRFYTADSTQLPFEDGEFDIVATNKVTHHISNWPDAVGEMLRVLKPGGYLIYADLVVPAPLAWLVRQMPTRAALDRIVRDHNLAVVTRSQIPLHYEGVFRKTG